MIDYQRLYKLLFNAVTDAIRCIESGEYGQARDILVSAQQSTEDIYISQADK